MSRSTKCAPALPAALPRDAPRRGLAKRGTARLRRVPAGQARELGEGTPSHSVDCLLHRVHKRNVVFVSSPESVIRKANLGVPAEKVHPRNPRKDSESARTTPLGHCFRGADRQARAQFRPGNQNSRGTRLAGRLSIGRASGRRGQARFGKRQESACQADS